MNTRLPYALSIAACLLGSYPRIAPAASENASITTPLRAAIENLIATHGEHYPRGREFLERLEPAAASADGNALPALQREALLANPLVSGQPILYVSRRQYHSDHHNTATIFQKGEINTGKYDPPGLLKSIDLADGTLRTIVDGGPTALARDPEVSFDGKRILFSMRRGIDDGYHIYEVNVDGTDLRQLTHLPGVNDIDPLYLPDGGIAFTSTREPKYCGCNRHIMANLYRMDGDGANIHQLGKSTLFEGHGALMPDGRIIYDRWEYVDRNFGDAQGLWTVNPDGTSHAIYYGNNTFSPGGVIDARIIPGTDKALCIFTSCHDRPWGALAILDRTRGVDGPAAVERLWPAKSRALLGQRSWDAFRAVKLKYEDPYPLAKDYFLVSRMSRGSGENTAIYLVDTFGNEIEIHREAPDSGKRAATGCFDPMPIGPRDRPGSLPRRRDFAGGTGRFYVQDIHRGTHMKNVTPGEIKYLRVVESPEKRTWSKHAWSGQGAQAPGMNWRNFENKRILGTVPVEKDGSAYFEVPADTYVFFQALDKDGKMVQSMRSGTIIQSGEVQGCVGCHENRIEDTPPPIVQPLALQRPPSKLEGWHGEPRLFSYMQEVQPIFDKHCLTCHDYGQKAADKLLLAGDRGVVFNTSYRELWAFDRLSAVGAGHAEIYESKSWGSHRAKLIATLEAGHEDVKLSDHEMDVLRTWVDINAPYYGTYACAYPDNDAGRCPLTPPELARLLKLTQSPNLKSSSSRIRPQVSFDRPEVSLCLERLPRDSAAYAEALALIRKGKEQLAQRPRADMAGFVPCEVDRQRYAKYDRLREVEKRMRGAIHADRKLYDQDVMESR